MTPDRIERLIDQRQRLHAEAKRLREQDPEAAEVKQLESLVSQIDRLMPGNRAKPRAARRANEPSSVLDVTRIAKGDGCEVRVRVESWKGRQTIDVRLWYVPKGGAEMVATRKGVTLDAKKLPQLIDALMVAAQHVRPQ